MTETEDSRTPPTVEPIPPGDEISRRIAAASVHRLPEALASIFAASQRAQSQDLDPLQEIAQAVQRVSGADLVVLYEYFEEHDDVRMPPVLAGSARSASVLQGRGVAKAHRTSVVFRLLRQGQPFYAEQAPEDWIKAGLLSAAVGTAESFFVREGVVSSACIPLRHGDEQIGLCFINYRHKQAFGPTLRKSLEFLASQAALAISSFRSLLRDQETIRQGLLVTANAVTVGQIATSFIHEAKNSLNSMTLTIYNLREDLKSERDLKTKRDYIARLSLILSEVERLDDLSRRLQRFSTQGLLPQKREASLNNVVRNTLHLLGSVLRSKQMRFEERLDPTLDAPILIDESQIQQVLMNLLLNAIAASPARSPLRIETSRQDGSVEIRITDYGTGISHEDLGKLFTPFFTTKTDGVGLGLFLSKLLIEENHSGSIAILETAPGRGTTFAVRLPWTK